MRDLVNVADQAFGLVHGQNLGPPRPRAGDEHAEDGREAAPQAKHHHLVRDARRERWLRLRLCRVLRRVHQVVERQIRWVRVLHRT